MTPDLSLARSYTDFQGFSDLRVQARKNSPEALKEVATQFEAHFIQMMLKSMRDASLSEGIFDSEESKFYMDMFDHQIALDLAGKQSLGIAEMMIRQLGGEDVSAKEMSLLESQKSQSTTNPRERHFDNPEEFITAMRPYAEKAAHKLGVSTDLLLAQSALETGWGQKIIKGREGQSSFNLFGIKSDKRWSGPEALVSSLEYNDGVPRKEVSAFRAYNSFAESFDDYAEFISNQERYQGAISNRHDPHAYIQSLQEAGYATDPNYADKVIDILDRGLNREI